MELDRKDRTFRSEVANLDIFVERISLPDSDKGVVLVLHGLGDHFGRYDWAVRLLTGIGYEVIGLDWPGNGRSEGKRGDLPRVDQVGPLLQEILNRESISPVGVLAHSTGGYFLIHLLREMPKALQNLRWIWLSSPLLHPEHGQGALKVFLAKTLVRWIPKLTLSTGVQPSDCYHLEHENDSDQSRSGNHNRVTLRFANHLIEMAAKRNIREFASLVKVPVLISQGSEDEICPPQYVDEFFSRLRCADKTLVYVSGARHEPFREPGCEGFLGSARWWILRQKDT